MKTNIAVVVPNWNGKEFLGDCLRSLSKQTVGSEVIVVDNGSTDGSATYINKHFPEVTLLQLDKNYGFAGGVNRGIELAMDQGCDFVALLNNDAKADKDWLKELLAGFESQPKVGIVTGKLLKMDGKTIDSTGEFCRNNGMPHPRGRDEKDNGQFDTPEFVFGASGGASMYRIAMLKQIGLFDEDFFAYFEDVDISFRAQLAGWKVWYQPTARAFHHIGKTSGQLSGFTRYHGTKNFILLYNKNMPKGVFWRNKLRFFARLALSSLGSFRSGGVAAYWRGLFRALLLMPSTLRKRRRIQKGVMVDTHYIREFLSKGDKL